MAGGEAELQLDEAFGRIEESILPALSTMLDALLEAAALARPGHDCEVFAGELRRLGHRLEALTRQVEAVSPVERIDPACYRTASAA